MSVYSLFDEFGVENCKIVWIEDCPCNSKKELLAVEVKHTRDNDCVNRYIAGRTNYDYWQEHKEYLDNKKKEYRTKNAEIIKQKKSAKVVCSCGSSVSNCHVSRQLQTKKHQQYLQNRSNPQEQ
jgi:cysteine synthase